MLRHTDPARNKGTRAGQLFAVLIVIGAGLRLLLLWRSGGTMIDDAYITARYAQNLLSDGSLVYNAGQHVLGVTCPLYAVWMSFLIAVTSPDLLGYAAGVSNVLFFVGAALLLRSLTVGIGHGASLLIVALFALHLRFVDSSLTGMETSLFVLGLLAAVLLLREEWFAWLSLVLGALVLVRPEAVFLAVAILAVVGVRRLRPRVASIVPGAAVVLAWTAWSWFYYGSPVPHSVLSKCGWLVPYSDRNIFGRAAALFSSLSLLEVPQNTPHSDLIGPAVAVFAAVSIGLFAAGVHYLWRQRSTLLVFPVLFVAYFTAYLVARGRPDFSWYGIPSGLAYIVTCVSGLAWLSRLCGTAGARRRCAGAALFLLTATLPALSIGVWSVTRLPYCRIMRTSYERAGEYVHLNCSPDALLLVDELGMIGWESKRHTHDLAGIVSPEIFDYCSAREWRVSTCDVMREFGPDVVVICTEAYLHLLGDAGAGWVADNYSVTERFAGHVVLEKQKRT